MIRVATLFSGIGAVEESLKKLKLDHKIIFACDNGERELKLSRETIENNIKDLSPNEKKNYIDTLYSNLPKPNYMFETYTKNFEIDPNDFHQDIRFLDGSLYRNKVDLLVGGSPCQSFSIIGKRGGFNDTRGTLFYEYARIIKEVNPKVFIFENVKGMINHDKGKTWETVKNTFKELNYNIYIKDNPILNAKDYGIPQNRPRLFIIGIRNDINCSPFEFPKEVDLKSRVKDYLFDNNEVDPKYYLGQKGFEFVSNPKYKNRAQINSDIMQCQKANQQFNWNGEFVFVPLSEIKNNTGIIERAYISNYQNIEGVIRKLTPIECVRLMGFDKDFEFPNIPDQWKYRQSGNSIVVNVFEKIIPKIIETGVFDEKKEISNLINGKLKLATLFSGIGAIEQALIRNNTPYEIVFACDNGDIDIDYNQEEEFNKIKLMNNKLDKKKYVDDLYSSKSRKQNYVKQSYLANYGDHINEDDFHLDINLLDGTDYRNKVDLLVGGSPCQSFSTVGFKGGLEDARGTLFYEYARIIKEVNPKVFIYENVRGLTTHDKGNTWKIISGIFKSLNYRITEPQILNAADYGIPQNRRRVFVVGIRNDIKIKQEFKYPEPIELTFKLSDLLESRCEFGNYKYSSDGSINLIPSVFDPDRVDNKYVLSNLVRKYVLTPGTKTFKTSTKYDLDIARTVLSTMGNRHRAGVDNYMTDKGGENKLRMLTEREALRLMGYSDDFKIVVSRAQMYKQAGNSIVVDVMLAVVREIFKTGVFDQNVDLQLSLQDEIEIVDSKLQLNYE